MKRIILKGNRFLTYDFLLPRIKNFDMLVIIPVLFTIIFGIVYSKVYVEEIPLAILDRDNSSTSRQIIREFENSSGFHIVEYVDSNEEMEQLIKARKAFAGLIIPKNFQNDIKRLQSPKALFLVDETNIVIGNNALSYGNTIFNTINAGLQLNILEGQGMVPYAAEQNVKSLSFVERVLYEPQLSYMKYVFVGLLGIFIQQTYLGVVVPILIEEKYRLSKIRFRSKETTRRAVMVSLRILLLIALTFLSSVLCLSIAAKYFGHPLRGSILYSALVQLIYVVNLTAISLILATVFDNIPHCIQFIMFLSVPTLLTAGYVWPEFMMPPVFEKVVEKVWPLIFFVLPMKELQMKGIGLDAIQTYINGGLIFALIWIPISLFMYLSKITIMKRVLKGTSELN